MKRTSLMIIVFFALILISSSTLGQKIEIDQTSYTTGGRMVVTDVASLDNGVILTLAAATKSKSSPLWFIAEFRVINKSGSGRYLDPGDNIFIVFKNGGHYQAKYTEEIQRDKAMMTIHVNISKDDWTAMGFNDGSGSQITEFRIEDTSGFKIYSFPISEQGSIKFYQYALFLSKKVL